MPSLFTVSPSSFSPAKVYFIEEPLFVLLNVIVKSSGFVSSVHVPDSRNLPRTTSPALGVSFITSSGADASTDGPRPISTLQPPAAAYVKTKAAAKSFIFDSFFIVFYPFKLE